MKRMNQLLALASTIGAMTLLGCGPGGTMPTAPVSGTVTCNGQPVPYAQVMFYPKAQGDDKKVGKVGITNADEQGNFVMTTYSEGDGAVPGTHDVFILLPAKEDHPDLNYECPCGLFAEGEKQVTVKDGDNVINFELPPKKKTKKKRSEMSEEELEELEG